MNTKSKSTYQLTVKSPGRANIIGEHIDYCGAEVLPFAVEESLFMYSSRIENPVWNIHAMDLNKHCTIQIHQLSSYKSDSSFAQFFVQVLIAFSQRKINISGLNIAFESQIPMGAGMSSSSALTCAIVKSANEHFDLELSDIDIVMIASEAENGTGVNGGKMDQYTIVHGMKTHVVALDCQTLTHTLIPFRIPYYSFYLLQSGVQHELVNSPYNARRNDIVLGLDWIRKNINPSKNYKNITESDIEALSRSYPLSAQRLTHTITEIARVAKAKAAIFDNDARVLGDLMTQTHLSLKNNYEVSCEEIDFLIEGLLQYDEVLGARIMGGGFGGSIILLAKSDLKESHFQTLNEAYQLKYNYSIMLSKTNQGKGIEVVENGL